MNLDSLILRLLEDSPIADQSALLALLADQGHALTQSTLSRRLKRLGVQKVQGFYRRVDSPVQARPEVIITEAPPNLLVLRTSPGFAQALGFSLDSAAVPGQVGTLAGDDTVFVAVVPERLAEVKAHLTRMLNRS